MRAAVTEGPFDADELDLDVTDGVGRLDFGAVRVPMPANAQLQIDPIPGGQLRAVHVLVPQGRLSLSALAAPRSSGLWRSLSAEIAESLRREGAEVRSVRGVWGREVAAGAKGAMSRFIGVDGSRWMLYGVAAGPAEDADELARTLRAMIKGTVVVRGPEPYPVKTVLPLRVPAHLEAQLMAIRAAEEVEPAPEPAVVARDEYPVPDEYSAPAPVAPAPVEPAPVAPAPVAPAPRREVAPARLAADDEWSVRDWAARELDELERRLAHRDWAARELDQVEQDRAVRERELAGEPTAPFPAPVTAPIPQLPILEPPAFEPAASEPAAYRPADEPTGTAASEPITEPLRVLPPTAPPTTAGQSAARPAADSSDDLETPRAWLAPQPEPAWPPVVTEPELSQLPAWAALQAAPQFWLDEHPGKHRAAGEDPKP